MYLSMYDHAGLTQVLVLNHALLSLWGSDSLAFMLDVDEYVMTPEPGTSILQVPEYIVTL
jgi:hypothetical protein